MKTATMKRTTKKTPIVPYPNAATKKELLQKFLDTAIMALTGAAMAAALLFLLALS